MLVSVRETRSVGVRDEVRSFAVAIYRIASKPDAEPPSPP